MAIRIYHNPRCSKSRATLALLNQHGIKPEIIDYQNTPPSPAQILKLAEMLGMSPAALVRSRDADKAGIAGELAGADDAAVAELLSANPSVIQRPIVVKDDNRAVIGRPPDQVLTLL